MVCTYFLIAAVRFVEDGVRSLWEGEIEVYYGGQWDRVCNIDWDINDAEVVCRELGFTGASSAEYSNATHMFDTAILDGALCTGEELHLLDCPRFVPLSNVTNDCLGNYAGVTCMCKYINKYRSVICVHVGECSLLSSPQYGHIIIGIHIIMGVHHFTPLVIKSLRGRHIRIQISWIALEMKHIMEINLIRLS